MFFSSKPQKINDQQSGSISVEGAPRASEIDGVDTASVQPQSSVQSQSITPVSSVQPRPTVAQPMMPERTSVTPTQPQSAPTNIYARPVTPPQPQPASSGQPQTASAQPTPAQSAPVQPSSAQPAAAPKKYTQETAITTPSPEVQKIINKMTAPTATTRSISPNVIRVPSVSSIFFPDLWLTPENIMFIRDERTKFALVPLETDDKMDFVKALEQGYTGSSSYALKFAGESYRVERIMTTTGVQYNCRKMPRSTPDIYDLGLPKPTIDYLIGLAPESGLILMGGPTGMGKTTTCSALIKKYLENEGGFLYTVEDPPEMPLDGLYMAKNGGLGLCKQTPIENERWGDGLKSALRSKPRYILVGEIRTPETASQALRAATSGHLVISTIHANSVEDALNSVIKYATAAGLQESLAADLLGRGILAVVHQKLEGVRVLKPVIRCAFANPNPAAADQMRMVIRDGKINLSTLMEAQETKLFQGKPLFKELV